MAFWRRTKAPAGQETGPYRTNKPPVPEPTPAMSEWFPGGEWMIVLAPVVLPFLAGLAVWERVRNRIRATDH